MSEQEYAKIIAKNLRRIMYDCGKTQADVARDLKINKATVSSWMNGTRTPKIKNIDLLCHYFNVSRADIMEEHEDPKTGQDAGYYFDEETAALAQEIFDNRELRLLINDARDASAQDIKLAHDMILALKRKERHD